MKNIFFYSIVFFTSLCAAQVGIGTTTPDASASLEIDSVTGGLLIPRMTTVQRNAIANPANGLMIYNTTENCIELNTGTAASPDWNCVGASTSGSTAATVTRNCEANGFEGSYVNGAAMTGSNKFSVTVTNNSFTTASISFATSDLSLSGISGVTVSSVSPTSASLIAGASQVVEYSLSGTPASVGTLTANWSKLTLACSTDKEVTSGDATFSMPQVQYFASANDGASPSYTVLSQGIITDGDQFAVPYTSGVGSFDPYTVTVAGVAQESTVGGTRDLTISYTAGTFAATGNITATIGVSGGGTTFSVPTVSGGATNDLAVFDFQVNGVSKGDIIFRASACAAKVNATDYKAFLCHNLGADTSLDPHVPVVGLQGAYIQWGRRGPNTTGDASVDWQTAGNTSNFAAAPTASNPNSGYTAWSTSPASDGAWNSGTEALPVKTANDPCPTGFRVPTRNEWAGVIANNTLSTTGTFVASNTNYGAAGHFGPNASTKLLTLPAAGLYNWYGTGQGLVNRGYSGSYWANSGTPGFGGVFRFTHPTNGAPSAGSGDIKMRGYSVRCIAE